MPVLLGSSYDNLRAFLPAARRRSGNQLHLVRCGHDPVRPESNPFGRSRLSRDPDQ